MEQIFYRREKRIVLHLFFAQFKDFMTIMLICAAVISGVMAYITGDVRELADTGILLFIILFIIPLLYILLFALNCFNLLINFLFNNLRITYSTIFFIFQDNSMDSYAFHFF